MVKRSGTAKKLSGSSIKRLSTGVNGLDKILDGGIPANSNILVSGSPGTGKSIFCYQISDISFEDGFKCLYITTNDKPEEVIKKAKRLGFFDDKEKDLEFIDCYSERLGKGGQNSISASNLNAISLEIGKVIKDFKQKGVVVFDSFSDILIKNGDEKAVKFMQVMSAKLKDNGCMGLFVIVNDMHEFKTVTSLESICDGVISMNVNEEGKRMIEIKKMKVTRHPLSKFEFKIRTTGIFMQEVEGFFK